MSGKHQVKTNLTRPATSDVEPVHASLSKAQIAQLTKTMTSRKYKLLPSEALHLLNHRVVSRDELDGLIEELEQRMDMETQEELVVLLRNTFEEGLMVNGATNGDDK